MKKYICVSKDGFPVEGIIGRPIKTFIRKLLLTRRIRKVEDVEKEKGIKLLFN